MDWMTDGLCKDDHVLWFSHDPMEMALAKELCGRCPVQEECLEYALEKNIWDGILGGLDPLERKQHAKKSNRVRHGSIVGYTTDRCRCLACKTAMTEYDRDKRPRKTTRAWTVA